MRIRFSANEIEILTPAKVNLFLELLGRREDGYHQLETIISSVSLFDSLRFRLRNDGKIRIRIHGAGNNFDNQSVPTDERNLVVRSMRLVREIHLARNHRRAWKNYGADIECLKRIPTQAGLGGASGNAAAGIVAANRLWNCNFSVDQMRKIGSQIGSDVPFFLSAGIAICRGRGEQIDPIQASSGLWLVIAKPPVGLSTGDVFRNCTIPDRHRSPNSLLDGISLGNARRIGGGLFNRLQTFATIMTDWIDRLAGSFARLNCLGHQMTGSGSSYFGVFSNRLSAIRATSCLSNRYPNAKIFTCQTLNHCRWSPLQAVAED